MKTDCTDCGHSIPRGQAHIRSICFERVALCHDCADRRGWERIAIPGPRGIDREQHSLRAS